MYSGLVGCATIPPCTVSPIEIEVTREDVKLLEKDLVVARDRAKKLSTELASKKAELNGKKDQPDELRRKLVALKKGSGRHEDQKRKEKKDKDEEENA